MARTDPRIAFSGPAQSVPEAIDSNQYSGRILGLFSVADLFVGGTLSAYSQLTGSTA